MSELHLVTGGAGYFGTRLVQRLHCAGRRVRIFDINDARSARRRSRWCAGYPRLGAVRRALEGASVVHHNVALVPLAKDNAAFWSVNRDGTRQLLEASSRPRFGRSCICHQAPFRAPDRNPVDDSTVPRPLEDYGRAETCGESFCRDFASRGLDVTILRPAPSWATVARIMQILFEWVREGKNSRSSGGGNLYQFVHADDLADAADESGRAARTGHVQQSARRPSGRCGRRSGPRAACGHREQGLSLRRAQRSR